MKKFYAFVAIMLVIGLFPVTTDAASNNKTLTVTVTGSGAVSSTDGHIVNCTASSGTCSYTQYTNGDSVTLNETPVSGNSFTGWGGLCSGTSGCTVSITGVGNAVTAAFSPSSYLLSISVSGNGSVSSTPSGISSCTSSCSSSFSVGASVTLSETPTAGNNFSGWGGACSGTGSCVVSMTAAKSVTAAFIPILHTLSVSKAGTGSGSVSSLPSGITCGATCSANYNEGTSVTLTAAAASGSTFTGWSGACSGTDPCSVSMSANKSVTATFALATYALNVGTDGHGTITSNAGGINCGAACTAVYTSGTSVTLTATPNTGYTFAGWSGDCTGTGSCVLTMTAVKNVTASFNLIPIVINHRTLSVSKSGTGTGLVVSDDAQINCGATCSQNGYNGSDNITLTATADAGSTFTGWSGDCSGFTCSVHMSQDRNVTANFDISVAPLSPNPITNAATSVTASDAVLNATNGQLDATGHSFWVSTNSPIDTSTPNIPSGVYSSPDLGAISANANFSYNLSDITTHGVPGNLPAITPNTTYYFVAWSLVGGTWYPGQQLQFTTSAAAPSTVTVTIAKFVNGAHATTGNTGSASFPMQSTWSADNIGSGTGTYSLSATGFNNPNAYEATTSDMTSGASYTTHETSSTSCTADYPFSLVGYSTGSSLEGAKGAEVSTDFPSLTNITSNQYIIVWNKTCPPAPTHLSPADNSTLTSAALTQIDWSDVTDPASPITYYYEVSHTADVNGDGSLTSPVYVSGELTSSSINTPGTPDGVYYWHVRAKDSAGNYSAWTTPWKITVAEASAPVTGSISGTKFIDSNGNGVWDDGEDSASGWDITLWQDGEQIDSTATNEDGNYSFTGLTDGDYVVCEDLSGPEVFAPNLFAALAVSPSWFQSFPTEGANCGDNGNGYSITIDTSNSDATDFTDVDFGNYQQGAISGMKFNDSNQDGVFDSDNGEVGLSGWTIQLYDSTGTNLIGTTTTSEGGFYSFSELTPSTYVVKEVNQSGWVATIPVDPASFTVNVTSGNTASEYNFGNHFNGTGGGTGGSGGGTPPADPGTPGNNNPPVVNPPVTPPGQVLGDNTGTGGDNGSGTDNGTGGGTNGGTGTGNGNTGQTGNGAPNNGRVLGASTTNSQVAEGNGNDNSNGQVEGANTNNGNSNTNTTNPSHNTWWWWLLLLLILIALYIWYRNRGNGNGPTA